MSLASDPESLIGVRFGTSCIRVATMSEGFPVAALSVWGSNEIPAYIGLDGELDETERIIYGDDARNESCLTPENCAFGLLRFLSGSEKLQEQTRRNFLLPFHLHHEAEQSRTLLSRPESANQPCRFSPDVGLSELLTHSVRQSLGKTSNSSSSVVVAVNAGVLGHSRDRMFNIIQMALSPDDPARIKLVSKSTAALVGYATQKKLSGSETVAIVVLGAFFTELVVYRMTGSKATIVSDRATIGLGGDYLDARVMAHCAESLKSQGVDIFANIQEFEIFRRQCQDIRKKLSMVQKASADIPTGQFPANIALTRKVFEEICQPDINILTNKLREVVIHFRTKFGVDHIDRVIVAGGVSRTPCVQRLLAEVFGEAKLDKSVAMFAELAAVYGAAALASSEAFGTDDGNVDLSFLPLYTNGGSTTPADPAQQAI